jgi:hypothetical protein
MVTPVAKRLQAPRKSQVLQTCVCVVSILSTGVRQIITQSFNFRSTQKVLLGSELPHD